MRATPSLRFSCLNDLCKFPSVLLSKELNLPRSPRCPLIGTDTLYLQFKPTI